MRLKLILQSWKRWKASVYHLTREGWPGLTPHGQISFIRQKANKKPKPKPKPKKKTTPQVTYLKHELCWRNSPPHFCRRTGPVASCVRAFQRVENIWSMMNWTTRVNEGGGVEAPEVGLVPMRQFFVSLIHAVSYGGHRRLASFRYLVRSNLTWFVKLNFSSAATEEGGSCKENNHEEMFPFLIIPFFLFFGFIRFLLWAPFLLECLQKWVPPNYHQPKFRLNSPTSSQILATFPHSEKWTLLKKFGATFWCNFQSDHSRCKCR